MITARRITEESQRRQEQRRVRERAEADDVAVECHRADGLNLAVAHAGELAEDQSRRVAPLPRTKGTDADGVDSRQLDVAWVANVARQDQCRIARLVENAEDNVAGGVIVEIGIEREVLALDAIAGGEVDG